MVDALVTVSAPITGKRPPGTNWDSLSPSSYPVLSANLTWSWGSEPGQAVVVYPSDNPINVGSAVRLTIGKYHFAGICESEVPLQSSHGNTREMTIVDYRKWLAWDKCYCLFNQIEDTMVNGVRKRRYWHVLPNNFNILRKTYTTNPYTVAQMCSYVLTGPGIETPWSIGYINVAGGLVQDVYHPNMLYPVYNVDCLSGKPVSTWLTEMCEQCGLLYTIMSSPDLPFNLVFGQKGVDGPTVTAPATADNIQTGEQLSGNPVRVRVLGDRNLYQVHDINLVPDWNTAWTTAGFWDINAFTDYVYRNGTWYTGSDPENIIARQLALSAALEMTVWEFDRFCSLRGLTVPGVWLDNRMYAGKCRNAMPAALYIQNVLLRCFRLPDNFWFANTYRQAVDVDSLEVQDKLLAKVTHDPVNGLTNWSLDDAPDGNAYVVVQGYQVGKDAFDSIQPDRFNVVNWLSSQDIWQKIEARVESSNDNLGPVIVFEEPVIRSEDLVTTVNGYAVFQANPTITIPPVRATLTFAAEKFSWFQTAVVADPSVPPSDPVMGTQTHDEVLNVGGLNGEFIVSASDITEIEFADDKTCREKAVEFSNNFLKFQWLHAKGSFTVPLDETTAYALHGKIDRVSLAYGPNGNIVSVSLTNERDRPNYVPERELDRMRQLMTLLPGQAELRRDSNAAKKIAISAATSRDSYKLLSDAFSGIFTDQASAKPVVVEPPTLTPVPMGSVYLGIPGQTRPKLEKDSTDVAHYFAGVTVRHNEAPNATSGGVIKLQTTGIALCRVLGPVSLGDSLVTAPANANNVLVKSDSTNDVATNTTPVGVARKAITGATVALIPVQLGAGVQATDTSRVADFTVIEVLSDRLTCVLAEGGEYITVAKAPIFRAPTTTGAIGIEAYYVGQHIIAAYVANLGLGGIDWIDLNVSGPQKIKCYFYYYHGDYIKVLPIGTSNPTDAILVAKPPKLRHSLNTSITVDGVTLDYINYGDQTRDVIEHSTSTFVEHQKIIPSYSLNDEIYISKAQKTGVFADGVELTWIDTNEDGRAWARSYNQAT